MIKTKLLELYKQLESEFDVKIFDLEFDEEIAKELIECNGYDNYQGCSSCSGRKIYLGFYNDDDLKLISLFHELGHITWETNHYDIYRDKYDNRNFPIEVYCTHIGIQLAYDKGIYFSDHALSWIYSQAFTYLRNVNDQPLLISKVMTKEFVSRKEYGRAR